MAFWRHWPQWQQLLNCHLPGLTPSISVEAFFVRFVCKNICWYSDLVLGVPAQVEVQLAERKAELAQCRDQLQRTEQLLDKARNAAALAPVTKSSSTPAAVAAAMPAPPQKAGAPAAAKPDGSFPSMAGCG